MHLLDWAYGISQQQWFDYEGPDSGPWYGQLNGITVNKTAWNQVYNWMVGNTMSTQCALASGSTVVWTCGFTKPNGTTTRAVWNTSGSSSYAITAAVWTDYKDLAGNTTSIASNDTSVSIGIKPILLESSGSTAPSAPTGLTAIVN